MSVNAPTPTQPTPPAPRKKHRKWPWIIGGLVALLIIVVANDHGTNAPVTSAPLTTAPAPTTAQSSAAAPVVLYTKSGSGSGSTPKFTTGPEWQVAYTYDCSNFGQSGNFQVTSEDYQLVVNQLGTKGADTEYAHDDPGSHALTINSECAWTIKVIG